MIFKLFFLLIGPITIIIKPYTNQIVQFSTVSYCAVTVVLVSFELIRPIHVITFLVAITPTVSFLNYHKSVTWLICGHIVQLNLLGDALLVLRCDSDQHVLGSKPVFNVIYQFLFFLTCWFCFFHFLPFSFWV